MADSRPGTVEDTADELADASNVLVLAPSLDGAGGATCADLLDLERLETVIGVTYTRSPDQWLSDWRRHVDDDPRETVVVSVGEGTRSAAAPGSVSAPDSPVVEAVENPGDLTGLGITLNEALSDRIGRSAAPTTSLCFDSLTVLLQYVALQRAFRFLHVLTNHVTAANAVAHYHLDPEAHDEQTVAALVTLFDAVIEIDADEGLSVRTR